MAGPVKYSWWRWRTSRLGCTCPKTSSDWTRVIGCFAWAIAAKVGPHDLGQAVDGSTDHALWVVGGEYSRPLGLIQRLQAVPIDQRRGD